MVIIILFLLLFYCVAKLKDNFQIESQYQLSQLYLES